MAASILHVGFENSIRGSGRGEGGLSAGSLPYFCRRNKGGGAWFGPSFSGRCAWCFSCLRSGEPKEVEILVPDQTITAVGATGHQPYCAVKASGRGFKSLKVLWRPTPCGRPRAIYPYAEKTMTDIGDGPFHKGEPVWVMQDDGSQRAAEYVGVRETSAWFGGAPTVIVVYPDTRSKIGRASCRERV